MKSSGEDLPGDIDEVASRWIARRDAGFAAGDAAEFAAWRARDPRHDEALARHEEAWRVFDRSVAGGKAEAMARELGIRSQRRRRRRMAGSLAAVASLLVAGWLWQDGPFQPALRERTPTAVVVVPDKHTLSDGTVIELKGNAKLEVDYTADSRRVTLRDGEAHFQVTKDFKRPFIVAAGGVEVRAVGTAFAVQFETGKVEVLVTEGRVAVERPETPPAAVAGSGASPQPDVQAAAAGTSTFVDAGKRVVVPTADPTAGVDATVMAVTPGELAERLAWRGARIEFTGTPLAEAVALMNLHAAGAGTLPLAIDPAETGLARLEVSGYFRATNTEAFIRLIEQTLHIRAERDIDRITLRRKR